MSRYLFETQATRRARNRIAVIKRDLASLSEREDARDGPQPLGRGRPRGGRADREALELELRALRRSVNDREMGAARVRIPEKRCRRRASDGKRSKETADRRSAERVGRGGGDLAYDPDRGLWGEPRSGSGRLEALPAFADPVLNRAADIFRVPGLAHYLSVQIERQDVFAGFEETVSAWAPRYGSLAFADIYADCEIDLEIAAELQLGETARADRLMADATGGRSSIDLDPAPEG